jgi:hypothetical protein
MNVLLISIHMYVNTNPSSLIPFFFLFQNSFKQSLMYKNQMKQVLLKALNLIKGHIIQILQNSSNTIDPNKVGKLR